MNGLTNGENPGFAAAAPRVWGVGALCRAIADALAARFNPVAVRGEISGFTRAASGHCYFTLKDEGGQLRCAMFRRAAALLDFPPREGDLVEIRGRLAVYEPRGELQMVVESLRRAGQGNLFEQFVRLKARLEEEGLFDAARKRALPALPRGIGVVTSLGAAAWHDVVTALTRRSPHIPVVLAPASVQGTAAPQELARALRALGELSLRHARGQPGGVALDVLLLVRGGGSMEDLWAFNDEALARVIAASPVPVVSGVGHETDFTIADFVADLRAPTPTAAAELCAQPRSHGLDELDGLAEALQDAAGRHLDVQAQRLDRGAARLGRPSGLVGRQQAVLATLEQRMRHVRQGQGQRQADRLRGLEERLGRAVERHGQRQHERVERMALRLQALDPALVLRRGYAWLEDERGQAITHASALVAGEIVRATLADGQADLEVRAIRPRR
ncbi:exodeoxyribonuclease VII large subunit [Comamonadaceae bacterium PP-2]